MTLPGTMKHTFLIELTKGKLADSVTSGKHVYKDLGAAVGRTGATRHGARIRGSGAGRPKYPPSGSCPHVTRDNNSIAHTATTSRKTCLALRSNGRRRRDG